MLPSDVLAAVYVVVKFNVFRLELGNVESCSLRLALLQKVSEIEVF